MFSKFPQLTLLLAALSVMPLSAQGVVDGFFYVDGWIDYQSSSDGVDIMGAGFTGNFPETKVDCTRIGVTGYMPINHYSGISVGYGSVISGRNLGKTSYLTAGLTVVLGQKKQE